MIYLPDTNAWIAYLNPAASPVKAAFQAHPSADIVLCSVVKAELLYGAERSSRRAANLQLLATLFQSVQSLPFDDAAAAVYGRIRADLARVMSSSTKATLPRGPYPSSIENTRTARTNSGASRANA